MVVEDAQAIYERAVTSFIKNDDENSAAELYFAVLNLSGHGHDVEAQDAQTLFRAQEILDESGVEDDLLKGKARRVKGSEVGEEGYVPKGIEGRQGSQFFRHISELGGESDREITPPRISDPEMEVDFPLDREIWREMRKDPYLKELALKALYSHRPTSQQREDGSSISGAQIVSGSARSREDVPHHAEHIGWFRSEPYGRGRETSGLERLTRALHADGEALQEIDARRQSHDDNHKDHPHQRLSLLGRYGSDGLSQGALRDRGLEHWKKEWSSRFKGDPDEDDFVNHIILRNEGVPEDRIWGSFYDSEGRGGDESRFKNTMKSANQERAWTQLGLLPTLLGLESLPPEEGIKVLEWFIESGLESEPESEDEEAPKKSDDEVPPPPGFEGIQGAGGLFRRIFRERLGAFHKILTDDLFHPGGHIPHLSSGRKPSEQKSDLSDVSHGGWESVLESLPVKPEHGRGEGKSILDHLHIGAFLPNVRTEETEDGGLKYTITPSKSKDAEPNLTHGLLNDYVRAEVLTEEQKTRIDEEAHRNLSVGKGRHILLDGVSAFDSSWLPMEGHEDHDKDVERGPSAAKVVYDTLNRQGGGHALGHLDVADIIDSMFPGFFFTRPKDALIEMGKTADWELPESDIPILPPRPHHPNLNKETMGENSPDLGLDFGPWFGGLAPARFATGSRDPFPMTFARSENDARNVATFQPASHMDAKRHHVRHTDTQKRYLRNTDRYAESEGTLAFNRSVVGWDPTYGDTSYESHKPGFATLAGYLIGDKPARQDDMMGHHADHAHLADLLFQLSDPENEHPEWEPLKRDVHRTLSEMVKNPSSFPSMMRDPMSRSMSTFEQRLSNMGLREEGDEGDMEAVGVYSHQPRGEREDDHGMHAVHGKPEVIGRTVSEMKDYLYGSRGEPPAMPDPHKALITHVGSDGGEQTLLFKRLEDALKHEFIEGLRPLHHFKGDIAKTLHDVGEVGGIDEHPHNNILVSPEEKHRVMSEGVKSTDPDTMEGYILGPHPDTIVRSLIDDLMKLEVGDIHPDRLMNYNMFLDNLRGSLSEGEEGGDSPSEGRMSSRDYLSRGLMSSFEASSPIARGLLYLFQNDPRFKDVLDDSEHHDRIIEAAFEGARAMTAEGRESFAQQLEEAGFEDEETLKGIREHSTRPWFNTSRFELPDIPQEQSTRLQGALNQEKEGALTGADLVRHYAEQYEGDDETKQHALDYLARMDGHDDPTSFSDSVKSYHKHVALSRMVDKPDNHREKYHSEMSAIGRVMAGMNRDQMIEGALNLPEGISLPQRFRETLVSDEPDREGRRVMRGSVKIQAGKAQKRFADDLFPFLYSRVGMNTGVGGEVGHSRKLTRGVSSLPVEGGRFDSFIPMPVLGGVGGGRQFGSTSYPTLDVDFGDGNSAPVLTHEPNGYPRLQARFASNVAADNIGMGLPPAKQTSYEGDPVVVGGARANPGESIELHRSFDALTDLDLLKEEEGEEDRKKGDFVPVKAMHRIFDVSDLENLRGFSGDWVISIWPQGERVIIERKGDDVKVRDSEGDDVDLPKRTLKGIKELDKKKDYILDGVWDDEHLHIVDILHYQDEEMENMPTKDRVRHLRATFEANEEVGIPAPVNTRRIDDVGLGEGVRALLKEPKAEQVLLRDADASYMMGESRHPKWVMLSPMKKVDVRVLGLNGKTARIGVGPIYEEVADDIGNRSVKYDGEYYMDVGTVGVGDVEEGDHITVKVDSVSHSRRKEHDLYRLNGAMFESESEAGATDSIETLTIMAGNPEDVPHRVRVSKGRVLINFPALDVDVIYKTENDGDAWLVHDPDAPHDYALNLAESQRPFWGAPAAILLRSEKEMKNEKKEYVKPEPLANHNKKPKKVDENQFFKRGLIMALEMIDSMLKEKSTFTGPKGLGIDYATPIESPSGPTKVINESGLPDYDPAAGHDGQKRPRLKHLKRVPIKTERGERATLTSDSEEAILDLSDTRV